MTATPEWMDYLRAAFALIFVVGLIMLLRVFIGRTGLNKRLAGNKGSARLSIAETLYLDPRRRVVIVRDGDSEHVLLLGVTGDVLIESRKRSETDAR
jgi:flagellar protein FliO/FliZ